MNWSETKQQMRDALHEYLSVPAVYSDSIVQDVDCTVRVHRKSAFLGDDYSEFSPGLFSQINRLIVDSREVTPQRGGVFVVPSEQNLTVTVDNTLKQGQYKILCEVNI